MYQVYSNDSSVLVTVGGDTVYNGVPPGPTAVFYVGPGDQIVAQNNGGGVGKIITLVGVRIGNQS